MNITPLQRYHTVVNVVSQPKETYIAPKRTPSVIVEIRKVEAVSKV